MNKPPFGDSFRRLNIHNKMFEVTAQNIPSKSVKIAAGSFWKNATEFVEFAGASTADIQPPSSGAKWVVVAMSSTAVPVVINGSFSIGDAVFPTIDKSYLPLAAIYYKSTDTVITSDMVFDVRPVFSLGVSPINHSEMLNRNVADGHTIAAITGLQTLLDTKITQTEVDALNTSVTNRLANKADSDGTTATEFTFNKDETGSVSTDVLITVNRGQQPAVSIKWNESDNKWQYTNDGTDWFDLTISGSVNDASTTVKGIVKLATAPANAANPIAVGDNDTRLVSAGDRTNIGNAATHVAVTSGDPHGTLALLTTQNMPVLKASDTVIGSSKLSAAPADAATPIAVGDNDARLLTSGQKTNVVSHIGATSSDVHGVLGLLPTHALSGIRLTDTVTSDVYEIQMISGVLTATLVP